MKPSVLIVAVMLLSPHALAGDDRVEAAIGGAIGGGAGAAIGSEIGGRDGAIIGGAIGGAVGAAIATDDDKDSKEAQPAVVVVPAAPHPARHCPPGLAKQRRC